MYREDGLVKADPRKGLVSLVLHEGLVHFQWKDRKTGAAEEDLIVFPQEATFYRVEKCTSGRVFVLDFKDNTRLFFYWLQEPSAARDEEYADTICQYLANPNAAALRAMALSQMDRNQLLDLLAGFHSHHSNHPGESHRRSTPAPSAGQRRPVEMATLQSILSGMNLPSPNAGERSQPACRSPDSKAEEAGDDDAKKNGDRCPEGPPDGNSPP
eukprot:GGOE01002852.1.p1 GENE.GGOE01002852.1~~GGOE01002852.1.p1  ORF type:complete len:249 (-),score=67.58 GGOE01002852.1:566-1204(-)